MKKIRIHPYFLGRSNFQKLALVMKLTAAILLITCLHVSAGVHSQSRITLNMESADLKTVLAAIEKKTSYRFLYNQSLLPDGLKVNVRAVDEEVLSLLDRLLANTSISYQLMQNNLVVLKKSNLLQLTGDIPERGPITGKVTDSLGQPVAGASVRVKGSTGGTSTDAEGQFSMTVPDDAVLIISSVGYETQEVSVSGRTTINIILRAAESQLEQVVVIGYGVAAKRDLTGSITTVKGREVADKPATNPVAALQGKVAGLTVINNGRPGQEPDIRIRGTNTINGVKPIYVVDGIINDNINFINPADIESMEILKDPSSLAIFGVRGANGVIIVTTKKARIGQMYVNVNSSVGIKRVVDRIKVTNATDFKTLYDEQLANQGNAPFDYSDWQANTDWQDQIFQDAVLNYNNISITGATTKNKFYLGLGYITEEGVIKHEKLEKITINFNDELQVTKAIKIGINFNGYRSKLPVEKSVGNAVIAAPIAPIFNEEYGLYHTMPNFQRTQVFNPMFDVESRANIARLYEYRAVGSIFGEVKIIPELTARVALYADYGFNTGRTYSPMTIFYNPEIPGPDSVNKATSVNEYKNIYTKVQSDYLLTYRKKFGDHNLTALGGFTTYYNSYEQTTASVQGSATLPIPNDPRFWYANDNIGQANTLRGNSSAWENFTASFLFRALYSFKDRYLLNASFRRDGSSAFRGDNQWQNFAAIGGAWVVSEEAFMQNQSVIDHLKLKGSWGVLGNQNVGDRRYPAYPRLTGANSAVWGENIIQALRPEYFVDPNLHWEEVRSWEVGVELTTLERRLNFEANYYNKLTQDIIVIKPATGVSGGIGEMSNLGEVSNHGFEFAATWNDNISKDLSYSISGNLTTIKNNVKHLVEEGYEIVSDPSRTKAGYPIGYFYGFIHDGIYQTQEEIIKSPANTMNEVRPGDIKYRDVDGDGQITQDDRTMIGNPTPDFTYGISFSLSYKGFDLSVDGQGVYGNEIFRNWGKASTFAQFNFLQDKLGRWNGVGTSNWEPILHTGRSNNTYNSTYFIEDGSYFRIRNVQLGYNFSSGMLEKMSIKSLRVYLNAQNLKTFKNNTGYTPEFGGTSTLFGVDDGSYPVPAIYTFGVNLTF